MKLLLCILSWLLLNFPLVPVNVRPIQAPGMSEPTMNTTQNTALSLVTHDTFGFVPSDQECQGWWKKYAMLEHIQRHSLQVALIATTLARKASTLGLGNPFDLADHDFVQSVRVSALLHDLGKTCTIQSGGNHSQLGAAWVMGLTGNPLIAQGVMHHVHWPGPVDPQVYFLPLCVLYADKRVKHDQIVSIDERYSDLVVRYGHSGLSRSWMERSRAMSLKIERVLSEFLQEDLHAYSFNCRRLVG